LAIRFTNATTTLRDDASTGVATKLADLVVEDDGMGSNTLSLATGLDSASFEIVGGALYLKAGVQLRYETKASYAVRVQATDSSLPFSTITADFTLTITDADVTPTNLSLSNTTVADDAGIGALVGTLTTTGGGFNAGFSYSLVPGQGSDDNDSFTVVGDTIRINTVLNYATKSSYAVRIRTTSSAGGSLERAFTIVVTDANNPPSAVLLSRTSLSVPESLRPTIAIPLASITVIDDALGTNTLTLAGDDAAFFSISDGQIWLRPGIDFDYGVKNRYTVTVSARDASLTGSTSVAASFVLEITNDPNYLGREYLEPGLGETDTDSGNRSGNRGLIKRGAGTTILGGTSTHSGGTTVEAGEVIVRNAAALGSGRLTVKAGATVQFDVHDGTVAIGGLTVEPGGRLDVGYGKFTVPAGGYTLAAVRQLLLGGFVNGWAGPIGLASRSAPSINGGNVGYVVDDNGSITVGFAANGDTNLDGAVDLVDISNLISSGKFDAGAASDWTDGDFNYDGFVDILDILNFQITGLVDAGPYIPTPQPSSAAASTAQSLSASEAAFIAFAVDAISTESVQPAAKKVRFASV
jgi:autotransporter-associated beta strand protein